MEQLQLLLPTIVEQVRQEVTNTQAAAAALPTEDAHKLAALEQQLLSSEQSNEEFQNNTVQNVHTLTEHVKFEQEITQKTLGEHEQGLQQHGEQLATVEQRLSLVEKTQARIQNVVQEQASHCRAAAAASVSDTKAVREQLKQTMSNIGGATSQGATATKGHSESEDECSFYLRGIPALRRNLQEQEKSRYDWTRADPVHVISTIMSTADINAYGAIQRISVTDLATAGSRSEAEAVIIVMSSIFHKKNAIIRLRHYFYKNRSLMANVHITDCYTAEEHKRARALVRYGGYLKEQRKIDGSRVHNRRGQAILEVYKGNNSWERMEVSEHTLLPFFQPRLQRSNTTTASQQAAPPRPPLHVNQPGSRAAEDERNQKRMGAATGEQQSRQRREDGHRPSRHSDFYGEGRGRGQVQGGNAPMTNDTPPTQKVQQSSAHSKGGNMRTHEQRFQQITSSRAEHIQYAEKQMQLNTVRQVAAGLEANLGPPPTTSQDSRHSVS